MAKSPNDPVVKSLADAIDDAFGDQIDAEYGNKTFLQRKKDRVNRWVDFGKEYGIDLSKKGGDDLVTLIEECEALDQKNDEIAEENETSLEECSALEKEILKQKEEAEELLKEIEEELSQTDKELEAALKEKPQDPQKIAALREKREKLIQQREAVRSTVNLLNNQQERAQTVRTRSDQIKQSCHATSSRSQHSNSSYTGIAYPFNRSEARPPAYGAAMAPPSAQEVCDGYESQMAEMQEDLSELKEFFEGNIAQATQLLNENKQDIKEIGQNLNDSRQQLQSIREQFNQTRQPVLQQTEQVEQTQQIEQTQQAEQSVTQKRETTPGNSLSDSPAPRPTNLNLNHVDLPKENKPMPSTLENSSPNLESTNRIKPS